MNGVFRQRGNVPEGAPPLRRIAPQPQAQPSRPAPVRPAVPTRPAAPPQQATRTPETSPDAPGAKAKAKVHMRLKHRSKYHPLLASCIMEGQVDGKDTDVTFYCADGGNVRAHKIILSCSSKFFTNIFKDQPGGEMTVVSVPDITSDIMKLLVLMCYKGVIVCTSDQLTWLKEASELCQINWECLRGEYRSGVKLDVIPGKVMDGPNPSKPPPPPLLARPPVPGPSPSSTQPHRPEPQSGDQKTTPPMPYIRKPQRAVRSGLHQNVPGATPQQAQDAERDSNGSEDEEEFTFQVHGYGRPGHNQERRKSKLTPRVETETDDADGSPNVDPEQAQKMIKEWMDKVGKADHQAAKRPRLDNGNVEGQKDEQGYNHHCTVCNQGFVKEKAWRWHEERHVGLGLFKCAHCDQLQKSARAIWAHEQNIHGFVIPSNELEEPRPEIPKNFQIVEGRGRTAPAPKPTPLGQSQAPPAKPTNRSPMTTMRFAQLRKLKAQQEQLKRGPRFAASRKSNIEIGNSEGTEQLDSNKVKQLHWLYVCGKCDNCSDSSTKAVVHYRKCYTEEDIPFELTVTKYRQGFYGKCKCPICPRRYVSNGGFTIHVGHHHTEFRRLFHHTGAADDKLRCTNCRRKYLTPEDFFEHLDNGQECNQSPINEESMPLLSSSRSGSGGSTPAERNKRRTIVSSRSAEAVEEAPVPQVAPRSARLAQRASLKRALADAAEQDPKGKGVAAVPKRRESQSATVLNYPPADCPICGASQVDNISEHLTNDHKDLDVMVSRISPDLLRCRKCLITFDICDLLAHTNTCTGWEKNPQQTQKEEAPARRREAAAPHEPLPPGVGCSPIDRIENTDLFCKETLRKAMECGVCGRTSVKLGDIANCLRAHGVSRCALCFNSYSNKADYPQHLRLCHGAGSGSNKLKCPLCSKTFFNAGQVAGHMYSSHWLGLLTEMKQEVKLNGWFLKATKDSETVSEEGRASEETVIVDESGGAENDTADADTDETMDVDEQVTLQLDESIEEEKAEPPETNSNEHEAETNDTTDSTLLSDEDKTKDEPTKDGDADVNKPEG